MSCGTFSNRILTDWLKQADAPVQVTKQMDKQMSPMRTRLVAVSIAVFMAETIDVGSHSATSATGHERRSAAYLDRSGSPLGGFAAVLLPAHRLPSLSAHDLVRQNKEWRIDDREQRAYQQTLKCNHEPEQQWTLASQQHYAHAHLYFHRSQAVEQLERHQREREEDGKKQREHLHRRVPSLIQSAAYGFMPWTQDLGLKF